MCFEFKSQESKKFDPTSRLNQALLISSPAASWVVEHFSFFLFSFFSLFLFFYFSLFLFSFFPLFLFFSFLKHFTKLYSSPARFLGGGWAWQKDNCGFRTDFVSLDNYWCSYWAWNLLPHFYPQSYTLHTRSLQRFEERCRFHWWGDYKTIWDIPNICGWCWDKFWEDLLFFWPQGVPKNIQALSKYPFSKLTYKSIL